MGGLRFGFVDALVHSRLPPTLPARSSMAAATVMGADSYWVGDHLNALVPRSIATSEYLGIAAKFVPKIDANYEPWTMLGNLAFGLPSRLRLGVCVTDAGRRNPAVTAQAAATLHLLTRGRAILGIGVGEREGNEPYGVDAPHACAAQGQSAPIVVAVDALDLSSSRALDPTRFERPSTAYLQYTSGSTRAPAGVVLSHKNVITNCVQLMSDYIGDSEKVPSTPVSWLPFYHDMGLMLGIILPMINQDTAVLMSPMAFLQRPARWMQLLAKHRAQISSAPNFGFELAVRRTSDDDMAGLDLGHVRTIVTGAERVNVATLRRFTERFAPFNLSETAIRPSYGLAEATVYVATAGPGRAPKSVCFDYQQLSVGQAKRAENGSEGANLVSYGAPRASTVRIVDPETRMENPAGTVGEIWVQGDNVGLGYWRNPQQTEATFRARLVTPSPGTSEGPWLRTGDLGVIFEGELFITGRIKELLVVDGANHYPEDIEATIQEITGGRVVAIAVPDDRTEKLVTIIELMKRGRTDEEEKNRLRTVKREVASAISRSHRLRVADVVMVAPGSIPVTTSGKVRRSASVERYLHHEFSRLDAMA